MKKTVADCFDAVEKNRMLEDMENVTFESFEELHNFFDVTHQVTLRSLKKILNKENN